MSGKMRKVLCASIVGMSLAMTAPASAATVTTHVIPYNYCNADAGYLLCFKGRMIWHAVVGGKNLISSHDRGTLTIWQNEQIVAESTESSHMVFIGSDYNTRVFSSIYRVTGTNINGPCTFRIHEHQVDDEWLFQRYEIVCNTAGP